MKKLCTILLIATAPVMAETTTTGIEYYIPSSEVKIISDNLNIGNFEQKEKWAKISSKTESTIMNAYIKSGKVKKVIVKKIIDERQNGITAMFKVKEGLIPPDYNYSTAEENKKKVEEEYNRRKAEEIATEKANIAEQLGLK